MSYSLFTVLKGLLVQNEVDRTKQASFEVSTSATTSTKTILQASQTANRTVTLPDASTTLIGASSTDTLTNKTIDGDNNTLLDIALSSLKTDLADASKFIVRDASGIPVSNTKDVPAGVVVGTTDAQVLTNKTIDGDVNTVQDLPLTSLKAVPADANKVIVRDGSGVVTSSSITFPSSDIVGISDVQTLTNKTIDGDLNTIQDLALSSLKTELADASKFLVRDAAGIVISNTKAVPVGVVVGTTDTQVLSGKDFDGGAASNTSRFTIPKNTKANLDALTRKQATLVYASDENKVYADDGSVLVEIGGGAGSGATTSLDNLSAVAINQSLITDTNNTYDLGSDAIEYRKLWVNEIGHDDALSNLTISSVGSIEVATANTGDILLTTGAAHYTKMSGSEVLLDIVRMKPFTISVDIGETGNPFEDFYIRNIRNNEPSTNLVLNAVSRELYGSGGSLVFAFAGPDLSFNSHKLINVSDPTSAQDAATKAYVDTGVVTSGVSGSRPGSPVLSQMYFDTTLGYPIWFDGAVWIDALGTPV